MDTSDEDQRGDPTFTRRRLIEGAAATGLVVALSGNGIARAATLAQRAPRAQRGGTFRVGITDAYSNETLDPNIVQHQSDAARARNLFDTLTNVGPDGNIVYELAQSMEPNRNATQWQVKLRAGAEWHDGKSVTPEDVLYTFRRVKDPKTASQGRNILASIDLARSKKINNTTLLLVLSRPNADLPLSFVREAVSIVQDGAKDFSKPVGTGPFMYESFTPGDRSHFVRNPNYWKNGLPYVDALDLIGIPDATARANALLGGNVDAIESLPFAQAKNPGNLKLLIAKYGTALEIYMNVTKPPFNDPRVRMALRLAADREKMVASTLQGFGSVGNDLQSKGFPYYNSRLPQRKYDPERAKSLLKAAGQEGLKVTIPTADWTPGMADGPLVYAQSAQAAGIQVEPQKMPGDKYGAVWGKAPIGGTYELGSFPFLLDTFLTTNAPLNITGWKRKGFDATYAKAQATLNAAKRKALYFDLGRELWEEGGYIVWGYGDRVDAHSSKVSGLRANLVNSLGDWDFRRVSLAS